jgi:hypothetical protein
VLQQTSSAARFGWELRSEIPFSDETPADAPRYCLRTCVLPHLRQDGSLDGLGGMTILKTRAGTTAPTPLSAKIPDGPQSAASIRRQPAQDADPHSDPNLALCRLGIPSHRRGLHGRQTASLQAASYHHPSSRPVSNCPVSNHPSAA